MPSASAGYAPNLEKYLKSLKGQSLELTIQNLVSHLKTNQISGAEDCAVATAHCLLQVVARSKWQDVDTLLDNVSRTASQLARARPDELVIGNVARRILGLIRDEAVANRTDEPASETPSEAPSTPVATSQSQAHPPAAGGPASLLHGGLPHLLSATALESDSSPGSPIAATPGTSTPLQRVVFSTHQIHGLRSEVIDGIEEILDEINQADDQVGTSAEVQIRPGDHVFLHQPSSTVQRFVLRAAARRKFTVLVSTSPRTRSSTGPDPSLESFKKKLGAAGVSFVFISGGAAMAYMSRVDRVIIGASAIVADGGIVSDSGAAAIIRAAKVHSADVMVLAGIYKLSPVNPFREGAVEWTNPNKFVPFADGTLVKGVVVRAAAKEFIPGGLIDMYITNLGTHTRDHLSGLVADHYKHEDQDIERFQIDMPPCWGRGTKP